MNLTQHTMARSLSKEAFTAHATIQRIYRDATHHKRKLIAAHVSQADALLHKLAQREKRRIETRDLRERVS